MQTFIFECQNCGNQTEEVTLACYTKQLELHKECPQCKETQLKEIGAKELERDISSYAKAPGIISGISIKGSNKPSSELRNKLSDIRKNIPGAENMKWNYE